MDKCLCTVVYRWNGQRQFWLSSYFTASMRKISCICWTKAREVITTPPWGLVGTFTQSNLEWIFAWEEKTSVEINQCPKNNQHSLWLVLVWIYSFILQTHTQEVWIIDASLSVTVHISFFPSYMTYCNILQLLMWGTWVFWTGCSWLYYERSNFKHRVQWMLRIPLFKAVYVCSWCW